MGRVRSTNRTELPREPSGTVLLTAPGLEVAIVGFPILASLAVGTEDTVIVGINAQSSVETRPILAPLRGPGAMGHAVPQVSVAQNVLDVVLDSILVVVSPVTEQPLAVIVVKGEHVVVEIVVPLEMIEVGTHRTVTCNAVFVDLQNDEELAEVLPELLSGVLAEVAESDCLSLLDCLSSVSSLRLSISDVRLPIVLSIPLISPALISSSALSNSLLTHDNVFTISLTPWVTMPSGPPSPLFFFEPHGEGED